MLKYEFQTQLLAWFVSGEVLNGCDQQDQRRCYKQSYRALKKNANNNTDTATHACSKERNFVLHVSIDLDPRAPTVWSNLNMRSQIKCLGAVRAKILLTHFQSTLPFGRFSIKPIPSSTFVISYMRLFCTDSFLTRVAMGVSSVIYRDQQQKHHSNKQHHTRVPTHVATLFRSIAPSAFWIRSTNFFVSTPSELK